VTATTTEPVPQQTVNAAITVSAIAAVVCILGTLFLIRQKVESIADYDVWGGLVTGAVLAIISSYVLVRLARKDPDPRLGLILVLAFLVKQVGTFIRYYVVVDLLGGDALGYHEAGKALAPALRSFDFGSPAFETFVPNAISGTAFIRLATGFVYAIVGTSRLGGFMVFSSLGFWGLYLSFRAFRIAVPEGNHRRMALLLFLTPSLVFWPSSLGKESWLIFCIGLTLYGAARMFAHLPFGVPVLALGLFASAIVRPHLTVLLLAALILARMVGRGTRRRDHGFIRRAARQILLIGFVLGAVVMTVGRASSFFNLDDIDGHSLTAVLDETERRSSQGDSAFEPPRVTSPIGLPAALVTVLFRPFPHEAHNLQARVSALEGMVLLALTIASWKQLRQLPRLMRRYPMIAYVAAFVLLFVVAFSAVGNFGILARQRTQVLPMLFMLLSLPAVRVRRGSEAGTAEDETASATPEPVGPQRPRVPSLYGPRPAG
jgi:hypothetical protein